MGARAVELSLFEHVADALRSLLSDEVGPWDYRAHRRGIKVWMSAGPPTREHYEAQLVPRRLVDGNDGTMLEIGFHAEHPSLADNQRALDALVAAESSWREQLGSSAEPAPFLGRPEDWRRLSETWPEPDLEDPELILSIAGRLTDYIEALEAFRT